MHAIYSDIQYHRYTKMNLSTVKWAQCDKTQSRELLSLFVCVCVSLCTIVAHNIAENRPDNFPSCSPDNHHCSHDVYLREGGMHQHVEVHMSNGLGRQTGDLLIRPSSSDSLEGRDATLYVGRSDTDWDVLGGESACWRHLANTIE